MNGHPKGKVVTFSKTARQRVTECDFDLALKPDDPNRWGHGLPYPTITKIKLQK